MFILEGRQARAEIREQREIDLIISSLKSKGYRPALRAMVEAAASVAGLPAYSLSASLFVDSRSPYRRPDSGKALAGDILFNESSAFVLQPFSRRLQVWEVRHHDMTSGLEALCSATESATRSTLDGRRVRGMDFSWQPVRELSPRQYSGRSRLYPAAELSLKTPEYTPLESAAAKLLCSAPTRAFLIRLAQVGKARTADTAPDAADVPIEALRQHGLIRQEYLVLCRKDNRTICTTDAPNELESGPGLRLTCPTCQRAFKDELLQEIHVITDAARVLLSGSRWMSIWITDLLVAAGLRLDTIHWNMEVGGDELDIMTDALGSRVFFELKDREFGLGDSYPFAYRVSRYGGTFGIVATTDRVAEDAKKFFGEQARSIDAQIVTLEGVAGIQSRIPSLVDQVSRRGVAALLRELAGSLAIDPVPVISAWMERAAKRIPTSAAAGE